ncbi:MAG: class I SAM-dependent methyltransferase [Caldilineaceae bacterium]
MTNLTNNTQQSFRDKWSKNEKLVFAETLRPESDIFQWILKRNGFQTPDALRMYLASKTRILDAGCGNGRVTALLREYSDAQKTAVVGIDLVAADVAAENLAYYHNLEVYEKNLLDDLSDLGKFDFIYCQEVLHHTGDPEKSFANLCRLLTPGGEIAIYVYKKKAPIREFVDNYVRHQIGDLGYDEALKVCEQITELGKVLSAQQAKVRVPAVDVLEIPAGEYDLQRFIYHFFMKCFWNPDLTFHENVVINYDWYHPQHCSRYTLDEVRTWFNTNHLTITHECVDFYGITIRGQA